MTRHRGAGRPRAAREARSRSGATVTATGHELRRGVRRRRRDAAVPVRRGGRGDPDPAPGLRRRRLARLRARRRGRARPTDTGPTGPYDPARGVRCNPAKLLLDPYARAVSGTVTFGPEVLGYAAGDPDAPSEADSAPHVPRSLVVADEPFGWRDGARPRHRYADTIIYEMHVKGFTMRHPGIPPELRGTYAGLGHEAAIAHLRDLGVTAVELLPVHESVPEAFLVRGGLTNYWGYNTIGYFAPHQAYSAAVRGRAARRPGDRVQGDGGRAARAPGSRSSSTWCSTTPPRATRPARRCASAAWTTRRTTGWTRRPAAVRRHHRLRQLAERGRPGHPAADHGLAAVLGDRDARRRLPVRPGAHPGPPGRRVRPAFGVLRPGLAGSGGVPGQADRRAVGRRADGQLRPRPVPAAVARVERQVPGHHARLLAQPPGRHAASSPPGSAGSSDLYGGRGAARPPRST